MAGLGARIAGMVRGFLRDLRGVSATEFALVAPVLIAFYFGTAEIDSALSVKRKVTSASNSAADLVAQDDVMTAAEFTAVFTAVDAIMAPFDPQRTIRVQVSSVGLDGQNRPTIIWTVAKTTSQRAANERVTGTQGETLKKLLSAGTSVVMVEVTFPYHAPLAEIISNGNINMTETFYLRPRRGAYVCREVSATVKTCSL